MKKILIGILSLAMVLSFIPFIVSAELVTVYEPKENVALGKTYEATPAYTENPPKSGYQNVDGKELTDGEKYKSDLYGTCWHGFHTKSGTPFYVVIDLGKVVDGIIEFRMEMINYATSGIDVPTSLVFSVSEDNVNFTKVANGKAQNDSKICDYIGKLKEPVKARYVKAEIGAPQSGVFVFCSEFEVYNSTAVEKEASEVSEVEEFSEVIPEKEKVGIIETGSLDPEEFPVQFREGSRFSIQDGFVRGVSQNDTPDSIMKDLVYVAGVKILDHKGKQMIKGNVYTGCTLVQYVDKKIDSAYVIIVAGDVDNNPGITNDDSALVAEKYIGTNDFTDAQKLASDYIKDGKLTISDYVASKLASAGEFVFEKIGTTLPEEWDMKIRKTSDVEYRMSCTASNGKPFTLTFDHKTWGTWNIGTMTLNGLRLCGGGTDWEYVYRAGSDGSGNWVWSGGNHGNESLVEIKFYDGTTGEEIVFEKKNVDYDVKNLKIVEKTTLNWGDVNNYYCNVVRTYTVVGQKITLDVSYDFIKDAWFQLSYTCMFPVPKTLGLYIDFVNDDGTYSKAGTLKIGAGDYSGPNYGKLPASLCKIYGYTRDDISFLVQNYTKNDSTGNYSGTGKVFYWDMNTIENKLYVSKFNDNNMTKVPSGSHWETTSSWTLVIDTSEK